MDPISSKPVTPSPTAAEVGATQAAAGPREAFAMPAAGSTAPSASTSASRAWETARQQIRDAIRVSPDKGQVLDRFVQARVTAQLGPMATPQVVRQVTETLKSDVQFNQIFTQLYKAATAGAET